MIPDFAKVTRRLRLTLAEVAGLLLGSIKPGQSEAFAQVATLPPAMFRMRAITQLHGGQKAEILHHVER
jgi:hypothetical protein